MAVLKIKINYKKKNYIRMNREQVFVVCAALLLLRYEPRTLSPIILKLLLLIKKHLFSLF